MKSVSRVLSAVVATTAAGLIAVVAPAAAAAAPAHDDVSAAASFCTASTSGSTVSGNCTIDTFLGQFGATFNGTVQSDGYGSGAITMKAGVLGNRTGTWTGGPFHSGQTATITYSIPSPVGAFTGTLAVDIA
ncbi:MAG: hypothetical protein WBA97_06830 [Actinophytocola sp.]|uniref:hypothetical protein n=1 Tax=Actinophytocola sp. TaxID=1872138 RepID=UPI003C78D14D